MEQTSDSCPSSDSEPERTPKKPLQKRRRLLVDTTVPAVPVYSNKVQDSLQLFPESLKLPVQVPALSPTPQVVGISDEEEEEGAAEEEHVEQEPRCPELSPSPPPPPSRLKKRRHGTQIFVRKLRNLTSTLSAAKKSLQDEGSGADGDDVIVIEPSESQELVLKIRCRTDLYRVSIRMMDPLQRVAEHMGEMLKVHPSRILLLLRDRELPAEATPHGLGLGVADIIDCIVETTGEESNGSGDLQLRVQGKDKSSQMEITVQRGEPLQALMTHYRQAQNLGRRKLAFYFDGQRLTETRTPQELGMESGDVIEVWN